MSVTANRPGLHCQVSFPPVTGCTRSGQSVSQYSVVLTISMDVSTSSCRIAHDKGNKTHKVRHPPCNATPPIKSHAALQSTLTSCCLRFRAFRSFLLGLALAAPWPRWPALLWPAASAVAASLSPGTAACLPALRSTGAAPLAAGCGAPMAAVFALAGSASAALMLAACCSSSRSLRFLRLPTLSCVETCSPAGGVYCAPAASASALSLACFLSNLSFRLSALLSTDAMASN